MNRFWKDTLFARLFVLLWVTLVASHAAAFLVVTQVAIPWTRYTLNEPKIPHAKPQVIFPSLPPAGKSLSHDGPSLPVPGLPLHLLILDYTVRLLVMGMGAWYGSRWLTLPVQRLSQAARQMGTLLAQNKEPSLLDEHSGTLETQETARIFNHLARDLHQEFRSRELLFATVSHDLRTPLTRMRLRLEQSPDLGDIQQCISDIEEMNQLVCSALDMVRGQNQAYSLQATRIDALVQATVDDLIESGAPVGWVEPLNPLALIAMAEPGSLRRVLDNVIQNSLRHASQVQVSVCKEADQGWILIVVEDNGPGIPKADMHRVLEPLFTSEQQTSTPAQGHGLGLYIANDLMRRQSGSITLHNMPQGGLSVHIRLRSQ